MALKGEVVSIGGKVKKIGGGGIALFKKGGLAILNLNPLKKGAGRRQQASSHLRRPRSDDPRATRGDDEDDSDEDAPAHVNWNRD